MELLFITVVRELDLVLLDTLNVQKILEILNLYIKCFFHLRKY